MIKAGRLKKAVAAALTFAMVATTGFVGGGAQEVQAKGYALDKQYCSFDLENNQTVTLHSKYYKVKDLQDMKVKMTKYKMKDVTLNKARTRIQDDVTAPIRYNKVRQVSFTLTVTPKFVPTDAQIDKMAANGKNNIGGSLALVVVNEATGYNYNADLNSGVLVKKGMNKKSDWTYVGYKTYEHDGNWVKIPEKIKIKVSIQFDENINESICVGICGSTTISDDTKENNAFFNRAFGRIAPVAGYTTILNNDDDTIDNDLVVDVDPIPMRYTRNNIVSFAKTTYHGLYDNQVAHFIRLNEGDYSTGSSAGTRAN